MTKLHIAVEVDEKLFGIGAVRLHCDKEGMAYLKSILMEQEDIAKGLCSVCDSPHISVRVYLPKPTLLPKPKPVLAIFGYFAAVVILMAFLIGLFTLIQRHLL